MTAAFKWRHFAICFAVIAVSSVSWAEAVKLPLECSVKVIQSVKLPEPIMVATSARRPSITPTTPGAKNPQYRFEHPVNEPANVHDPLNGKLRFFLNLPNMVLLVEATITIDEVPFRMVRQQRIEQILRDDGVAGVPARSHTETRPAQPETTAFQVQDTSTILRRLRHTSDVTGEPPTAEAIDWIISNWVDGPVIMPLKNSFQRFRATQRPECVILDRDRDGKISTDELKISAQSFLEIDLNQDGIIQFSEIAAAATGRTAIGDEIESSDLILFVSDEASANAMYRRLNLLRPATGNGPAVTLRRFDANGNGRFDPEEFVAIRDGAPDLTLNIAFNSLKPEKSRFAVTAIAAEFRESLDHAKVDTMGITLSLVGTPVILTVVQGQPSDQISIGAVNDGYPILPTLDSNADGRLTIRELRGLSNTLKSFDLNSDGMLTDEEVQSPFRLCFGLGTSVHRELAGIRAIHRKEASSSTAGPAWFLQMDRNKDNDVTRDEFPGTDEQFKSLDTDADLLLSAEEASASEKNMEDNQQGDDLPMINQK